MKRDISNGYHSPFVVDAYREVKLSRVQPDMRVSEDNSYSVKAYELLVPSLTASSTSSF